MCGLVCKINSLCCHRGGPGSNPGRSMWDLWRTKWHLPRFVY